MDNEQIQTYLIPNNFIDESRTFNGMLKTRHVVEAAICLVVLGGASWLFIPPTVSFKLTLVLGISLPLPLACLAGVNGDSLFTFVKYATKWRKTKQVMLYNSEARTFQSRPIEVAMTELTPADRVMSMYEQWQEGRAAKVEQVELVENVDFVFMEDTEYEKMTIVPDDEKELLKEAKKQEKAAKERAKEQAKYEAQRKKELAREARRNKRKKKTAKAADEQPLLKEEMPVLDITPATESSQDEGFSFEDVPVETIIEQQEKENNAPEPDDVPSISESDTVSTDIVETTKNIAQDEEPNSPQDNSIHNDEVSNALIVDDNMDNESQNIPDEKFDDTNSDEDEDEDEDVVFGGLNSVQSTQSVNLHESADDSSNQDQTDNTPGKVTSTTDSSSVTTNHHKRKRTRSRKKKNNGGGNPQ